jgi:hypothetical protein
MIYQGNLTTVVDNTSSFPKPPLNYSVVHTRSRISFSNTNVTVNDSDFYQLERPIIARLNHGHLLKCYSSDSGWLCVYNIPKDDIKYINSLLYQLVRLKGLSFGDVHYLREGLVGEETMEYIGYDRQTRIFNRFSVAINKTDCINAFEGRVALSIKGLRVIDDCLIFLDVSVFQVKIEEEADTKDTSSSDCIFN